MSSCICSHLKLALGEVCHTFNTYENEVIYVNIKFLLVICKVKISFWWAHLNVQEVKFSDDILSDRLPLLSNVLKWEPIWKFHNSFTMYPALYVVIWCSPTGQVSHIFITSENALISVNFQLFLLLIFWLHIVIVVYYTTTSTTTTTSMIRPMRMKSFI